MSVAGEGFAGSVRAAARRAGDTFPGRLLAETRAGRLGCLCPADAPAAAAGSPDVTGSIRLGIAFALAVLSQALTLGMLPLAGAMVAPRPSLAALPFAAMFVGSAVATFPASLLLDVFGRRAALALGASLGIAGGALLAWGLVDRQFAGVVIGAFWLGIAQGFGLFYRHAAWSQTRMAAHAGFIFGAGALAGLAGPSLAEAAETLALPHVFAGTAIAAACAQVATLVVALLPGIGNAVRPAEGPAVTPVVAGPAAPRLGWRDFAWPTAGGALAWFMMNAAMVSTPLAMAGCGIAASAITGAVAWHVVAMYAPAMFVGRLQAVIGFRGLVVAGLALCAVAAMLVAAADAYIAFTAAFVVLGIGWSLATFGASGALYVRGAPTRGALALHDGVLFVSALGGAFARIVV